MDHLVRIDRNAGDSIDSEIERRQWIAGFFHEGDDEASETGVDVNGDFVFQSQFCDFNDGIHYTVRETRCWPHQLIKKNKIKKINKFHHFYGFYCYLYSSYDFKN